MADDLMSGYVVYTTTPDLIAEAHNTAVDRMVPPLSITLPLSVTVSWTATA